MRGFDPFLLGLLSPNKQRRQECGASVARRPWLWEVKSLQVTSVLSGPLSSGVGDEAVPHAVSTSSH